MLCYVYTTHLFAESSAIGNVKSKIKPAIGANEENRMGKRKRKNRLFRFKVKQKKAEEELE